MGEHQLTRLQSRSSKVNVSLSFFMLLDSILGMVSKTSQFGMAGAIGTALFFLFDLFLCRPFF